MRRSLSTIGRIADPSRRAVAAHHALRALDDDRYSLVKIRRDAVAELRADGWSWAEVASLLNIHRNRAAHLLDRVRPEQRPSEK